MVLLASPPAFRPMHLKAAVEAGKQIFCEKPMAISLDQCDQMVAAAHKLVELWTLTRRRATVSDAAVAAV